MTIIEFITLFKASFDELETPINQQTIYKEIEEWTSMQALFFIAQLDDETNIVLTAEDLMNTKTIDDLYNLVLKRI